MGGVGSSGFSRGLHKYPLEATAATSIFGLLAFMLALAFGVTAGRFAELRELVRVDDPTARALLEKMNADAQGSD